MHTPGVKEQFCERTSRPRTPPVPALASTKDGLKLCGHGVLPASYEMTGCGGSEITVTLYRAGGGGGGGGGGDGGTRPGGQHAMTPELTVGFCVCACVFFQQMPPVIGSNTAAQQLLSLAQDAQQLAASAAGALGPPEPAS